MKNTHHDAGTQAGHRPRLRCVGCDSPLSSPMFGGGVTNEYMEPGEYAPVCGPCSDRATTSGKARRHIERDVRRRCREGGENAPARVVVLHPDVFKGA